MTGCIPCIGNVKHATLIENCYPPTKQGGTTPRSSELSYLTFYASSRPAKLTKVGSYLQKKVTKDIRKGRKGNNQVSLHILKALIQTCHRDLNIFSKYVVQILSMILDTRDLELIDLTCETFIVFCSYHDGTTLGVDADLTQDYENLIKKFAGFCNYTNEDEAFALKMQYIGHRAIQAAVTSSALQFSNFKTQLSILFPPLIVTLANSDKSRDPFDITDGSIDIRDSVLDNGKVNKHIIGLLAAHTVSILFNKLTGPSVRISLVPLFNYLNETHKWWPPQLAVNIMKLVLESLQPQYRYLLVSEVLHQLNVVDGAEQTMINEKYAALVLILDSILNANIPLVGISVLEVLNSLFNSLVKSTQYHPFPTQLHENDATTAVADPVDEKDEKNTQYATTIQSGLVHSIGGLASQTYYENQMRDMVGYLVSKLRPNTALEYVDTMLIHDYRIIALCCLDSIVSGSQNAIAQNSSEAEFNLVVSQFPLDAWIPALALLNDKNSRTRLAFSKTLYTFLLNMIPKVTSDPLDAYPQRSPTYHTDAIFIDRFVHVIQDWVLIPDFNVSDLRFVYSFLHLMTRKFGIDATVMIVPLVFSIQQLIKEGKITLTTRQYAIESALISLFDAMGQFYHIESLSNYMKELQSERPKDDILLTDSINVSCIKEPELFTINVEDTNEKVNRVWIDRSKVVEIMSKEGSLRDEQDTHGLELEAKLFAEWGSDAFLNNDHTTRKKIFVEMNEAKPKLSSPWEHADLIRPTATTEERKDSIRVATLKEALVAQNNATGEDDVDSESTQTNSLSTHSRHATTTATTKTGQQIDMNALLNELNLPPNAQSTVSLVNPPYKLT